LKNEDEIPVTETQLLHPLYTFADLERMGEGTYYGSVVIGRNIKRKGWKPRIIGPFNITYVTDFPDTIDWGTNITGI
jgi:hypothetical protein|tara:strand:+ start:187 stop:417 length:231 start_codon:yes stop_codon:yes gene_type:complete